MWCATRNFIFCNPRNLNKKQSYDAIHKRRKKMRTFAQNWRSGRTIPLAGCGKLTTRYEIFPFNWSLYCSLKYRGECYRLKLNFTLFVLFV